VVAVVAVRGPAALTQRRQHAAAGAGDRAADAADGVLIPTAYGGGPWFGAAYLTVQWLVLAMQGRAVRHAERHGAFVAYASMASLAPAAVLIGGLLADDARTIAYAIAVALNVGAAFRGAGGEWALNPGHFAERHARFVIIALGEALVAIGATATELGLDRSTVLGAGSR
jgi:low temperature requirement protein LtrA